MEIHILVTYTNLLCDALSIFTTNEHSAKVEKLKN